MRSCQRRLPRRPWRPRSRGRIVLSADVTRGVAPPLAWFGGRFDGSGGGGIVTGKRGLWSLAKPGVQPNSGKVPPQPRIRYCWTIAKSVDVIQYRNKPAGRMLPYTIEMNGKM